MRGPDLSGLRVAVDVQHLYRTDRPHDQGTLYVLPDHTHITEGQAATVYAAALAGQLVEWGAETLTNDPARGILTGTYPERNRAADAWGAHVYLACHVNAGGGSYARAEAMASSPDSMALATRVLGPLTNQVPVILAGTVAPLRRGDRGPICIDHFPLERAAVILEPFFGDNPRNADLFLGPNLQRIGCCLAAGVAWWWAAKTGRPVA